MLIVLAFILAVLWLPSPWDWMIIGVAAVLEIGETVFWYRWSKQRHARVGVETLIGREATVVRACRAEGQVRLDGELWQAQCAEGADPGEMVVIEGVDRLRLTVRPSREGQPPAGPEPPR